MTLLEILSSVIVTIVPLGGQLWTTQDYCWGDIWGIYQDWKIYVCESWENTEFYIQHEKWHHIYSLLTQEQKDEYTRVYKLAKIHWINAFLRDYSYSDVEEDFADNFASWQTKEQVNIFVKKRIKLICIFLTSL